MDPAGGGSPLVGLSRTSETFQPIASYSDLKCASPASRPRPPSPGTASRKAAGAVRAEVGLPARALPRASHAVRLPVSRRVRIFVFVARASARAVVQYPAGCSVVAETLEAATDGREDGGVAHAVALAVVAAAVGVGEEFGLELKENLGEAACCRRRRAAPAASFRGERGDALAAVVGCRPPRAREWTRAGAPGRGQGRRAARRPPP